MGYLLSRQCSEMNNGKEEVFKERRKATAKKHYLKCVFTFSISWCHLTVQNNRNREAILKKADSKRWRYVLRFI